MSLTKFYTEKKPFKALKKGSSKSRKISPKMGIFSNFFFLGNIGQEIVFYDILETKNAFVEYKNNKFEKVEKLTFYQKG